VLDLIIFYGISKIPVEYGRDMPIKFMDISLCCNQRALVDESGVIGTQMRMHNRYQKMAAVRGTFCMIPPCNSSTRKTMLHGAGVTYISYLCGRIQFLKLCVTSAAEIEAMGEMSEVTVSE
jgi:hypothetical protein